MELAIILKKRFFSVIFILLSVWGAFFLFSNYALAAGADYSVTPILPSNQIGKVSYFDILVSPQKVYQLDLYFENLTTTKKNLAVAVNPAHTNQNGALEYTDKSHKLLNDLNVAELINGPKTVTLSPNEAKVVSYQLHMPPKKFNGILIGAFQIQSVDNFEEDNKSGLNNQFAYEIGLAVREEKQEPKAEVSFDNLRIKDHQLVIDITNNSDGRLSQADFTGSLTGNMEDKFSNHKLSIVARDKATLTLPFSKNLKAGTYQLNLKIPSINYSFKKDFKLQGQTKLSVSETTRPWIFVVIGFALLVIIGAALYLRRKRRTKENV